MKPTRTIRVIDGLMTLLDAEGNGCDAYVLRSYDMAKQKLVRWRQLYDVDDQEAFRLLGEFFDAAIVNKEIAEKMERIAKTVLNIPTLECRGSDDLDFHEFYVGQIELALRVAYEVGRGSIH